MSAMSAQNPQMGLPKHPRRYWSGYFPMESNIRCSGSWPVASTDVSEPSSPHGEAELGDHGEDSQLRAAEALRAAFERLAPQGSDIWNFMAAFTHLGNRFGPYKPGTSDLAKLLNPADGGAGRGRLDRLRQRVGSTGIAPAEEAGDLDEAMGHVIEAFRFLSARVLTLEERLARQDRPVDGPSWLTPDVPLGPWAATMAAHFTGAPDGGAVLHADCGEGELLGVLTKAGLPAIGVEPRGGVALQALERGYEVSINEVADEVAARPPGSLGGIALTGVVDRLPLHALIDLLSGVRRVLAPGAPLVIISTDPARIEARWGDVARDIVEGRPLHAQTWQVLLERCGFGDLAELPGPDGGGDLFGITASAPS
jgi:hypothetical protein